MSATVLNAVRRGFYLDSVALMRLSRAIAERPGVIEAALMMASPANKRILDEAGLLDAEGRAAAGNDLVIAVRANSAEVARTALVAAEDDLSKPRAAPRGDGPAPVRSLGAAMRAMPDATLALISVPGDFAVAEARKAMRAGLDVMIFSDNVPVADEVALKQEARTLGRLVMGPDCGTAIIGGHPIAFANVVPRGEIGIVGASGTGTQEVSCLIAQGGGGISQAIGVGGRDLAQDVGGLSTLTAIDLLDADAATKRVVLISKPPHPNVARAILTRVGQSPKPYIVCFLGADAIDLPPNARAAATLRAAAEAALGARISPAADAKGGLGSALGGGLRMAAHETTRITPRPGAIVGLYSGGTLCAEAQLILAHAGRKVASNAPAPGAERLRAEGAKIDRLLDLGADEYTRGRPHPMIDPSVRDDMLRQSVADNGIAVVLVDVVLGFGAHRDPAGHLAAVLASVPARHPHIVASVTGTEADPQVRSRQVATLERAGVIVAPSNAHAAERALTLARG
jgi:FdrA protein